MSVEGFLFDFLVDCVIISCRFGMFFDAVGISGDEALCLSADGACWPFMREKTRLILFGTYPYDQQWRAALASLIVIGLVGTMIFKRLKVKWMVSLWVVGAVVFVGLMLGNVVGLPAVQTVKWNGLPVFLLLAVFSLAAAFPSPFQAGTIDILQVLFHLHGEKNYGFTRRSLARNWYS